ncbi:PTS sugar transporter subunit IIA [Salinisphaera japonica]|uniref:PTS sugar transporter subunit IIA n=1 Tax=Salinisphaera japonica YTM-1 TaxID=1209778 RepID=A0A423PUY4_9GAMM|nr:PTS sugar transporter subunit IIA [Salinisphaera japonica]ROO29394.1 PTS sugar transporter subunit IIA [Salinisphaera japonica YTM-1]
MSHEQSFRFVSFRARGLFGMTIADIVAPERVRRVPDVQSKKRALEQLAEILAEGTPYLTAADVFNGLIGREKLGSTAVGDGVALPHARMKGTDDCIGAFIRLPQGVDFQASDNMPVDLIFGMLVPEAATDEHLKLLRALAELFSNEAVIIELRDADDDAALYRTLLANDVVLS